MDNLTAFCALLGSGSVKAAHRMLMKLTPGGGSQDESSFLLREILIPNDYSDFKKKNVMIIDKGNK